MALSQEAWPRKNKTVRGQGIRAVNAVSPLIRTVAEAQIVSPERDGKKKGKLDYSAPKRHTMRKR